MVIYGAHTRIRPTNFPSRLTRYPIVYYILSIRERRRLRNSPRPRRLRPRVDSLSRLSADVNATLTRRLLFLGMILFLFFFISNILKSKGENDISNRRALQSRRTARRISIRQTSRFVNVGGGGAALANPAMTDDFQPSRIGGRRQAYIYFYLFFFFLTKSHSIVCFS